MTIKNNDFSNVVFNRHSIKEYDAAYKIPKEEMLEILAEATKAPSSVNMQPWRFVVVESEAGKEVLKPLVRFNQRQNSSSSAMIVIFGDMECYEKAEQIYDQAVAEGKMPQEVRDQQLPMVVSYYKAMNRQQMNDVVKIDSSLAAMQLMLVARAHGYDTNPIGGFESDQIAAALGLDSERFVPVMIVSIGKATSEGYASSRLPVEEVITWK